MVRAGALVRFSRCERLDSPGREKGSSGPFLFDPWPFSPASASVFAFYFGQSKDAPRVRAGAFFRIRAVDVLVSQGRSMTDAIRQIGVSEVTFIGGGRSLAG